MKVEGAGIRFSDAGFDKVYSKSIVILYPYSVVKYFVGYTTLTSIIYVLFDKEGKPLNLNTIKIWKEISQDL